MSEVFGNPYALIVNNEVTEVVFMHSYSEAEISEELSRHVYDEAVSCAAYGEEIFVGWQKFDEIILPPAPHPLWTLNKSERAWDPPEVWDESIEGWFPLCNTCSQAEDCTHCTSESSSSTPLLKLI